MIAVTLDGIGAVYHRVSTDTQDAARQRATTREWCDRNGVTVQPEYIYEDEGWSRADAERRPAFQQLLDLADRGKVNWIVVDRQDRAESYDKYETAANIHRLRRAGCRLFTVDGRELTASDIMSFIQTGLASEQSELELKEKSVRALEGKRELAKRGEWMGGKVPTYGMDVVAFRMDARGDLVEQWRVEILSRKLRVKIHADGTRKEYTTAPVKEADEIFQLRPTTNKAKLDVVRRIFSTYANERTTPGTIARQLNQQGVEPPAYSRQWLPGHVRDTLDNPAWIGHPTWNRHTSGKYHAYEGGQRVAKGRDSKPKRHAKADWVMSEVALYPAVIDPATWAKVQAKLDARHVTPRATRSSGYLFSGLIQCGNCGGTMTGSKMPTKGGKPKPLTYLCSTYNGHHGPRETCKCKAYRVHQSMLEEYLSDYLRETCPLVSEMATAAATHKPESLKLAIQRAKAAHDRMLDALDATVVVIPDSNGNEFKAIQLPCDDLVSTDQLASRYQTNYADNAADWDTELGNLLAKQDELIETLGKIPKTATHALARVQCQLDEVDAKIRDVEGKLANAADEFKEAEADYARLHHDWEAAQQALAGETSDRRKAEAIRQVVSKIVVTFKPTNKSQPVGVVEWIEVVPQTQGFTQDGLKMRSR